MSKKMSYQKKKILMETTLEGPSVDFAPITHLSTHIIAYSSNFECMATLLFYVSSRPCLYSFIDAYDHVYSNTKFIHIASVLLGVCSCLHLFQRYVPSLAFMPSFLPLLFLPRPSIYVGPSLIGMKAHESMQITMCMYDECSNH